MVLLRSMLVSGLLVQPEFVHYPSVGHSEIASLVHYHLQVAYINHSNPITRITYIARHIPNKIIFKVSIPINLFNPYLVSGYKMGTVVSKGVRKICHTI